MIYCNHKPHAFFVRALSNPTMFAARSRHPGGVQVVNCDGSVDFTADSIDISVWRAMSTTQGAEPL